MVADLGRVSSFDMYSELKSLICGSKFWTSFVFFTRVLERIFVV